MEKPPIEQLRIKVGNLERNMKALKIRLCEAFLLLTVIGPFCNAAAQSPSTIGGRTFQLTISSGNFPFASSGSYRFLPSATSSSYAIVPISGAVSPSSGTHSYTKTGANTAQLAFTDSFSGSLTANCTFTTPNSGTYRLTGISVPGSSQTGTFSLYSGTSPASISGYSFTVTVTSGASPFASSGTYRFLPAASGNTYNIVGLSGIPNSSGTYSYTQNSTMTGIISFNDSITGPGLTSQLSFDTATSGTVFLRQSGNNGYQTAVFTMVAPVPPRISVNPQNQAVVVGSNVTFTVSATGGATLSYQWRKGNTNIAGATGSSFTVRNVQMADAGTYDVVVSDAGGSTTSGAATLTVEVATPPTISVQPMRQIATVGQNAGFSVTATGTAPLSYQWRKDGINMTGSSGASFIVGITQANQAGNYSVVITNFYGSVTSSVVVLMVRALSAGNVVAWGYNMFGQTTVPSTLSGVAAVAAGGYHTVALKTNGTLVAWGLNDSGQTNVPAGLTGVKSVAAAFEHSVALKSNGTVVAWGWNINGQTTVPIGLSSVVAIAAGFNHTVALKSNGTVVAWGRNTEGQRNVPIGLSGVIAIAAGGYHTVALKSDGTVVAWGSNGKGQTNVPYGLGGIKAIAAGFEHTAAVKTDNTVVAWGENSSGQTNVPFALSDVTAIAAGAGHTVALKNTGTVVAWGNNVHGQAAVPEALSRTLVISAGDAHTVAIVGTGLYPLPSIATTATGNMVEIIWPATATGYRFESALNLSPPTTWSNVTGTFQTNGGLISIGFPITGARKFFRLTNP